MGILESPVNFYQKKNPTNEPTNQPTNKTPPPKNKTKTYGILIEMALNLEINLGKTDMIYLIVNLFKIVFKINKLFSAMLAI